MTESVTVPEIRARKRSRGADPIVMITAYDTPFAPGRRRGRRRRHPRRRHRRRGRARPGGHACTSGSTTSPTTSPPWPGRARGRCSWATCPGSPTTSRRHDTVRNAAVLVRAGAQAVKLEGGRRRVPAVRAILDAEIPVMGHLGLTPQSVHAMGGYKVQGREAAAAGELRQDAEALAAAGCFADRARGRARRPRRAHHRRARRPDDRDRSRPGLRRPGDRAARPARARRGRACRGSSAATPSWASSPPRRSRTGPPTSGPARYPSDAESYHASPELREALRSVTGRAERLGLGITPACHALGGGSTRRPVPRSAGLGYHVDVPYTPAPSRRGAPSARARRVRRR